MVVQSSFVLVFLLASSFLAVGDASSHSISGRGLKLEPTGRQQTQSLFPQNLVKQLTGKFFPVIQATTPNSLNTSVSFTVPLFSLSTNARDFDLTSLGIPKGSSNLLVLLAVSTVVIGLAVIFLPLLPAALGLVTSQTTGRSINDGFSSFMTNGFSDILYTLADNPFNGLPGIDPEECVKRCICEAHNGPSKYGWLAVPFQLFFPPYSGNQRDDDPSKMSKFQLAARYGKSDNANCGLQYHGCMFNPLDIIQTIMNWFLGRWRK